MADKQETPKALPAEPPALPRRLSPATAEPGPTVEVQGREFTHADVARHYQGQHDQNCHGAIRSGAMKRVGNQGVSVDVQCSVCKQTITLRFDDAPSVLTFLMGFFDQAGASKGGHKK